MKLNKVLALALSGVMAVSMLAGCKGGSANGEQGNTEQPVVTSSAADILNKIQNKVDFKSDAATDSFLNVTLKASEVKELEDDFAAVGVLGTKAGSGENVYDKLTKAMKNADAENVKAFAFKTTDTVSNDDDVTYTQFYAVKSDEVLSVEHLMLQVAEKIGVDSFADVVKISKTNYNVDYTGSVSVKQVSGTDEDGSYSAYLVAVSITRAVGEKAVVPTT